MNDIEYLMHSYFNNNTTQSKVTSSHWQKYGKLQRVTYKTPRGIIPKANKSEGIGYTFSTLELNGGGIWRF